MWTRGLGHHIIGLISITTYLLTWSHRRRYYHFTTNFYFVNKKRGVNYFISNLQHTIVTYLFFFHVYRLLNSTYTHYWTLICIVKLKYKQKQKSWYLNTVLYLAEKKQHCITLYYCHELFHCNNYYVHGFYYFCFKTTALSAKFVSMSITYLCYIGYKCAVCYLMPSIIFFSVPFSM